MACDAIWGSFAAMTRVEVLAAPARASQMRLSEEVTVASMQASCSGVRLKVIGLGSISGW